MKKLFASAFSATLILFSSYAFAAEFPSTPIPEAPKPPQGIISNRLVSEAPLPGDFVLGNKDAKVVVIEYASLSCPHCAHFAVQVLPEFEKKYVETGKVRFIYREYPLNEPALRAAMLARCAGAEKFHTFTHVLFTSQEKWAFQQNFRESLEKIALLGGMTKESFAACMADKALEKTILEGTKAAADAGIQSTPSFIIGGKLEPGMKDLEGLSAAVDKLLEAPKKKEEPKPAPKKPAVKEEEEEEEESSSHE